MDAAPQQLLAASAYTERRLSSSIPPAGRLAKSARDEAGLPNGTPTKTRSPGGSLHAAERSVGTADQARLSSDSVAAEAHPRRSPRVMPGPPAKPPAAQGTPSKAPVSSDGPAADTTPRRSPRHHAPQQGAQQRSSLGSAGGAVSPTVAAAEAAARLANADWFDPLDPAKVPTLADRLMYRSVRSVVCDILLPTVCRTLAVSVVVASTLGSYHDRCISRHED